MQHLWYKENCWAQYPSLDNMKKPNSKIIGLMLVRLHSSRSPILDTPWVWVQCLCQPELWGQKGMRPLQFEHWLQVARLCSDSYWCLKE